MERIEKQRGDMFLVVLLLVILGVGMALLFSSSSSFSGRAYDDPLFLLKRQLLWAALGGAAAFIVSLTPLSVFRRWMPLIVFATLAAVLLPFLPGLGASVLGSRRWIIAVRAFLPAVGARQADPRPLPRLVFRAPGRAAEERRWIRLRRRRISGVPRQVCLRC